MTQINTLVDYKGWEEVEVTVDSGACDIVMPVNMCSVIPTVESERQRDNMEYEVANGETIPNRGEKRCLLMTMGARVPQRIVFHIADVHKALLSASWARPGATCGTSTRASTCRSTGRAACTS